MRRGVTLAVVIGVFIALSADLAMAKKKVTHTQNQLKDECTVLGGDFHVTDSSLYFCTLPDGSAIICGGSPVKCEDVPRRGNNSLLSTILATQATILNQQEKTTAALNDVRADILDLRTALDDARSACAPPDLVPVPQAGSTPPNFCQTDANNNFFVRVRNQGMSEAAASTLRVTFTTLSGLNTVEVATPVLTWGGGFADLVVAIPEDCFGPWPGETTIGACNFQIAVDAAGVVAESNEPNNNVAGACVPVL